MNKLYFLWYILFWFNIYTNIWHVKNKKYGFIVVSFEILTAYPICWLYGACSCLIVWLKSYFFQTIRIEISDFICCDSNKPVRSHSKYVHEFSYIVCIWVTYTRSFTCDTEKTVFPCLNFTPYVIMWSCCNTRDVNNTRENYCRYQ